MMQKGLDEAKKEVQKLSKKHSIKKIRKILEKEGYSHEIISWASIENQIEKDIPDIPEEEVLIPTKNNGIEEINEAKMRVKELSCKYKAKEIRKILEKEGYSCEVISGVIIENQKEKAHENINKTRNKSDTPIHLLIILILIISLVIETYLILRNQEMAKLFLIITLSIIKTFVFFMIIDALHKGKIRWAIVLIFLCLPIPIIDIIGSSQYYITEKASHKA